MKCRYRYLLASLVLLMLSSPAAAGEISFATGVMALSNSTTQGGQGAEGSTFLTQTDLTYTGTWWGAGLFFQYDRQGESEIDTASGPRFEVFFHPFYLEYAYAVQMNRSFTDRAIAEQEGNSGTLGLGARFSLSGSSGGSGGSNPLKGFFLQFSYKIRTQVIKEQDGKALDEPITQKDTYPLFGLGFGF